MMPAGTADPIQQHLSDLAATPELAHLRAAEYTRLRELLSLPRLYIRRRAEDVCFERLNLAHVSVSQNIVIPPIPTDLNRNPDTPLSEADLGELVDTTRADRIVPLGFFPKRLYLGLEAHAPDGAALPLLTLWESARVLAAIILAQCALTYNDDPRWLPIRELLYSNVEPLIRKAPRLDSDLKSLRPARLAKLDHPTATANFHLDRIITGLTALTKQGNDLAEKLLDERVSGDTTAPKEALLTTLDRLTRTSYRFVIVRAAVGERVVIGHSYRETVLFEKISKGPRRLRLAYATLSQLALVPRHVGLRALNHTLAASFHLTVHAPSGTTVEYVLWAERDRADKNGWVLQDDLGVRGPLLQISSQIPATHTMASHEVLQLESAGDAVAGIQLSRHGTARPALVVTALLTCLLAIGVIFPDNIIRNNELGGPVAPMLALPVAAMALLVQQLPQPFAQNFAHFLRWSLWSITGIGFLAATLSATGTITSAHWMVVLSASGLFVTVGLCGLLYRLCFDARRRGPDVLPRDPPYAVIRTDVEAGLQYLVRALVASFAIVLLIGTIGWYRL